MMKKGKSNRRTQVIINYLSLITVNICFYVVFTYRDMTHIVDVIGLSALLVVGVTFVMLHWKSGLWQLVHLESAKLDERELEITHYALSISYGWFTVICLVIMLVHAVLYRLVSGVNFVITVPLVGSLIYLAHTLPSSVLAWTEDEVPGDVR